MGAVGIDSCSINSSGVYSGGSGGGIGFWALGGKFLREFFDRNFASARSRLRRRRRWCVPAMLSAMVFSVFGIVLHAAAVQHAVGDLLHPERAFAAGRALAAAFVRVKLVDVGQRPDHVARIVHAR